MWKLIIYFPGSSMSGFMYTEVSKGDPGAVSILASPWYNTSAAVEDGKLCYSW